MIYHLLYPLSEYAGFFNVIGYITFRSIYALLTALLISIILGPAFISWLEKLRCGQHIQEDVETHRKKQGTPTMGGVLIVTAMLGSVLLWGDLTNIYLWVTVFVFLSLALLGFMDDFYKVVKARNKGLSAKSKFLFQIIVGCLAMTVLIYMPEYSTKLYVPFFKWFQPDLGWFYLPFAVLVIAGASNAVNLTDGLDGLAIGPAVIVAACFTLFIYVTGHIKLAEYLQVAYIPGVGEVSIFCGALIGAGLGFLWFNAYPAQVFMGDVGSLSLGGTLGFLSILSKQELVLIIVGGLFVVEALSVILQVGYFKMSKGRRIFQMAPIHHHFELKGLPESKIIVRFWILSIILALLALSTLKLR